MAEPAIDADGTTEPIRVLVVDDEALVRAGFRVLLETSPGLTVVGEAADGAAAVLTGLPVPLRVRISWISGSHVVTS